MVKEHESYFTIGGTHLEISKSYVIKTNQQDFFSAAKTNADKKTSSWTNFYLDPDFFNQMDTLVNLRALKNSRHIFIYGRKSYGIIWNSVIDRMYSRPLDLCFFCDEPLKSGKFGNKTVDHLIPTVIITAYGMSYIDDNKLPCCKDCNREKASLHPYVFREKVKIKIKNTKQKKWSLVLKVLNKILIEKKDIFR